MNCRFCRHPSVVEFLDLGFSPLSNAFLDSSGLNRPEMYYPLRLMVCDQCWLVQIDEYESPARIFHDDYAYFSSYSASWVRHAQQYAGMITERLKLGPHSCVVEIAANDGYLLQFFKQAGIPCFGVEPAGNTAQVARTKGIEIIEEFFGAHVAAEIVSAKGRANLIAANNVLAHVPDPNDFVSGLKVLLDNDGVVTIEVPYLANLVDFNQFDTVYHEHFSYFSMFTLTKLFQSHALEIFDFEHLTTHGGSLRLYVQHRGHARSVEAKVGLLLKSEERKGMQTLEYYRPFQKTVDSIKNSFLDFLIENISAGKKITAYGAAAKGNTLLNYCGVRHDLIEYVVDASPHKQGRFLPGSHIPVYGPEKINETRPDFLVILPWNIRDEIMHLTRHVRDWGCRYVTAIPEVAVFD